MQAYGGITASTEFGLKDLAVALRTDLLHARRRESCHYKGGEYVLVELGDAEVRIEQVDEPDDAPSEFLVHFDGDEGDAGDRGLRVLAGTVSSRLVEVGLRHRIEIYDGTTLVEYLHCNWPQTASRT